jgi:hypothetical protein
MKIKKPIVALIIFIFVISILCNLAVRFSMDPKPWLTAQHSEEVLQTLTRYWQVKSSDSPPAPILDSPFVLEYTDTCMIVTIATVREVINYRMTWIYKLKRENPESPWRVVSENHLASREYGDYIC